MIDRDRPQFDCATTNASSLTSLCSGCVMANWSVINIYSRARLVRMIWSIAGARNHHACRQPAKNPLLGSANSDSHISTCKSFLDRHPTHLIPLMPATGTRTDQRCVAWHDPMDGSTVAKRRMGPTSSVRFPGASYLMAMILNLPQSY